MERKVRFFDHKKPWRDGETDQVVDRPCVFLEVSSLNDGVPFLVQREKVDADEINFREAWEAFLASKKI